MTAPDRLRIGIIGAGHIAERHCAALVGDPRVALVAACDVEASRAVALAERFGTMRIFAEPGELLRDPGVDVVIICTPPTLHAGLIVAALRAGKRVICEKPVVVSLRELDECLAVEKETGGEVACIFQWRFGRALQMLEELKRDGHLGRLLWANVQVAWFRDAAYYAVPWRGTWASESGGVTVGQSIHAIDAMLAITGPARRVTAQIATLNHAIEVEDYSGALIEFAEGGRGVLQCTVDCMADRSHLMFGFEKGTFISNAVAYHCADLPCELVGVDAGQQKILDAARARWETSADRSTHGSQLRHVVDDWCAGRRHRIGLERCRASAEVISGIYKSARGGGVGVGLPIERGDLFYGDWGGKG